MKRSRAKKVSAKGAKKAQGLTKFMGDSIGSKSERGESALKGAAQADWSAVSPGTLHVAEFAAHAGGSGLMMQLNPTLERIKSGIPITEFETLAGKLGLTQEEFGRKIGISIPTLSRRKKSGAALDPEHSDRLIRFQRLLDQTVKLFDGNEQYARNWLRCVEPALAYQKPIDLAETEAGAREVENVIGRLEYGELA